ncbi:MAG: hypothetical protein ACMG6E_08755 [Candidatus Roizmanbacteria bacterium]
MMITSKTKKAVTMNTFSIQNLTKEKHFCMFMSALLQRVKGMSSTMT